MGNNQFSYTSWMQNGPSNPNIGQFNSPNVNIDNGGGSAAASKPVTVPTTGNDYTGWNWEQTLVGVLGLQAPDRNDVTAQRWTAINFNSDGGSGLLRIFAATWRGTSAVGTHQDIFVYLNPNLLQPNGIWDNYFHQPYQALYDAVSANYTGVQIDPRTFTTAADEVEGVSTFYLDSAQTIQGLSDDLQGDASAFKGQAGEAFAQLVNNLYQVTNSVATQMTTPTSYWSLINDAGEQSGIFLASLYNAMTNWTKMLDYQPLGAIYQAMEDGGVITVDGSGNYQMTNANSTDSSYGDLTDANTWLAIENAAKQLWLQSITSALDSTAQTALHDLAIGYLGAASGNQPLNPPTLTQISTGNPNSPNDNGNTNNPNDLLNNLNSGNSDNSGANLNLGGDGGTNTPAVDTALGGSGGDNGNLNVPSDSNTPAIDTALGGGGAGGGGGGGNLNIPSSTNTPALDAALGGINGLSALGGANTALGGIGSTTGSGFGLNSPQLSGLRNALASNGQTQAALQQALSLAPSTGPLHNALTTALANNTKARTALQAAMNGTESAAAALQAALSGNGQTQAALRQALTLAPSKGPLHNAIEAALGDSNKTQSALNQSLTSGAFPETSRIHQALNSDNAVSGALHKALLSSDVPSRGPLHTALSSALANSGEVKSALDRALAGGPAPGMPDLHQALSSNAALQSELRNALSQAPAHGSLHNALTAALADSKNVGTQIHQALAQAGVAGEPGTGALAGVGNPAASLTGPSFALGKNGLTASLGGVGGGGGGGGISGLSGALGGGGIAGGLAGHGGGSAWAASTPGLGNGSSGTTAAAAVSSGSSPGTSSGGTSAVPFFPPMAGAGGIGMGGQQQQERERTIWLAEDEGFWGTDPQVGPAVIGRDLLAGDDEDLEGFDDFDEASPQAVRAASPANQGQLA